MNGQATIPLLIPWWLGAAVMLAGALEVYLGHRQRRAEFDITRIPLTSASFKVVLGLALILFGASQALGPLLG